MKKIDTSKIIKNLLHKAKLFLKESKIKDVQKSSSFDAEEILCFVLNFEKKDIFLNFDKEIDDIQYDNFFKYIKKRFEGMPVAYITYKKYFFDFEFFLNKKTLIPREDSEILIQKALEIFEKQNLKTKKKFLQIADFGAGSGCLGLSFLKKYENAKCFLIEKNLFAAKKINENIKNLQLEKKAKVFFGDWNNFCLKFQDIKLDLIISNPPYINLQKKNSLMKSVVFFEPNFALFDKNQENFNKNSTYQQILSKAEKILKMNGYVIFEIDEKRQPIQIEKRKFKLVGIYNDLYGLPRCMILRKIF